MREPGQRVFKKHAQGPTVSEPPRHPLHAMQMSALNHSTTRPRESSSQGLLGSSSSRARERPRTQTAKPLPVLFPANPDLSFSPVYFFPTLVSTELLREEDIEGEYYYSLEGLFFLKQSSSIYFMEVRGSYKNSFEQKKLWDYKETTILKPIRWLHLLEGDLAITRQ